MLLLRADPRRVRSAQQAAGRGAGDDGGQGDDQRVVGLGVLDEHGAEEGAGQHGDDRDQAAAGLGPAAPGVGAVGGDAGEREGEHGGGQVGDRDGAGGGGLDAHGDAQGRDEGVPVAGRWRAAAGDSEDDRGGEERGLGRRGGAVQPAAVGAVPRGEPAAEQGSYGERRDGGQRRGDREPGGAG